MRQLRSFILVAVVVLGLSAGCRVPAAIRTEIDFLHVVISTGVKEADQISNPAARADKAVRALKRAEPHSENLRRWAEGEDVNDGRD
ncbi:hypothetical protein LCGC14_0399730 [marine sediment metagenome]|uniref:Uncharacterized protein n=1 Tax=marine sediment metagenome TaxID=412755 RepID=A0A0F9VJ28_9ZZZZ